MAVPKRKTSHSATRTKRNHKKLTYLNPTSCSHCGDLKMPHTVCPSCGYYKNQLVLKIQ